MKIRATKCFMLTLHTSVINTSVMHQSTSVALKPTYFCLKFSKKGLEGFMLDLQSTNFVFVRQGSYLFHTAGEFILNSLWKKVRAVGSEYGPHGVSCAF